MAGTKLITKGNARAGAKPGQHGLVDTRTGEKTWVDTINMPLDFNPVPLIAGGVILGAGAVAGAASGAASSASMPAAVAPTSAELTTWGAAGGPMMPAAIAPGGLQASGVVTSAATAGAGTAATKAAASEIGVGEAASAGLLLGMDMETPEQAEEIEAPRDVPEKPLDSRIEGRARQFDTLSQTIAQRAAAAGAVRTGNEADMLGINQPRRRRNAASRALLG